MVNSDECYPAYVLSIDKEIFMFTTIVCSLLLAITLFTGAETQEQLLSQYQTLKTSLRNQRGIAPGDMDTIRKLRDELSDWSTANSQVDQVIAAELQLSMWLGDAGKCNALFEELTTLQPENTSLALAWAQYMLTLDGANPDVVYGELVEKFPNSSEIMLGWISTLDSKNQFTKAIIALEKLNPEVLAEPRTAEMYSTLLYADNRFDESIAALDAINSSALEQDPVLSTRISSSKTKAQNAQTKWQEELSIREVEEVAADLPLVVMQTSKGPIEIELFEDHAPNTVANFISLVDTGYYDGILFHRVIPKFMAQGGDPNSREGATGNPGEGGPGYKIKDEHTNDDHRKHFAGSLSMAKTGAPNTGGSQFFLTHMPTPHLDGQHTVFGRITSGLNTARSIEKNDEIVSVMIIRKRDHDYTLIKVGEEKPEKLPTLTPSLNP